MLRKVAEGIAEKIEDLVSKLPAQVLFDLARNESASKEYRKAAVRLLIDGGHRQAEHPELRELVLEIKAEKTAEHEVLEIAARAIEEPTETKNAIGIATLGPINNFEVPEPSSPPAASVTTKSLLQDEQVG